MWISTSKTSHRSASAETRPPRPQPKGEAENLRRALALPVLALLAGAGHAQAQEWLDQVQDRLSVRNASGSFHSDLSGLLDVETYSLNHPAPTLIYTEDNYFNPRATFYLDTVLGKHFYSFVQARVDRGFDPGEVDGGDARLDEYLLRWTPLDNQALNLQFGKFATVAGSWVNRHDSWDNPLITPPLAYNNLTTVSGGEPPSSRADFLGRRSEAVERSDWLPVIWGPAYTTGWSVFGSLEKFDYALELKNASVSSHPDQWTLQDNAWQNPTVSGRLGYRPNPAWNHGVSFSIGPYMYAEAKPLLPPGKGLNDYDQINLGYDVSYAWHHWQFWGELFLTRFQVPTVGNADMLSYYLEARYQVTSQLFVSFRWNQQLFGTVADGAGGDQTWGNDSFQWDQGVGYRFTRHLQSKLQYSYLHSQAGYESDEHMVAWQMTVKF